MLLTARLLMTSVATPPLRVTVPIAAPLLVKVTVPVGTAPLLLAATVALSVTGTL